MSMQLFTIGYEGTTIDKFLNNLLTKDIDCIIDVRKLPLSRKPGFSKTKLSQRLNKDNIQYVHLSDLGTPKEMRNYLKSTRDYQTFFKKMDKYLSSKKDALKVAYNYVNKNKCCLMCFEYLASKCHRKLIAKKIKAINRNGLKIKHL